MKPLDGPRKLESRLRRLEEVSWNFDGDRSRSLLSSLHFHPARFISQVPSILISRLSQPDDVVLDPFCGSGTTLVEAQRLSRRAVGCDINPVSVLISRAKTLQLSADEVASILRQMPARLLSGKLAGRDRVPATVQIDKWYSPAIASALATLHEDVLDTADSDARLLKTFCLSSILLKACRETRHWGYVCDNTDPRDHPPRDIIDILARATSDIVAAFAARDRAAEKPARVIEGPAKSIVDTMQADSVDLVVTSPPYEGVVDYVKSQRLTMEWLGLNIEQYRLRETGARSKRHRSNSLVRFSEELRESFEAVYRVMKPGAACVVVFGVSPQRGYSFEQLKSVLNEVGFTMQSDLARDVSVQRTLRPSVMTERLYVLTKPFGQQG